MSSDPPPELAGRLGYLLKHVQLRLAQLNAAALAPLGLSGRELAVLLVLDGQDAPSQQDAAARLGVDRTTLVDLLDGLEAKGFVARRPDEFDRRRNVLELTVAGRETLREAILASDEAERRLLAPLDSEAAAQLKEALLVVMTGSAATANLPSSISKAT